MTDQTSQPLTTQQLDDIASRVNAVTPGLWGTHRDLTAAYTVQARPRLTRNGTDHEGDIATLTPGRTDAESYANARFIAHAPEDVRVLLAEIRRLRARIWEELERPATEAERNALRQSFLELAAQAEEDRDFEGAFDVRYRLREREEQWAAEDAARLAAEGAQR